MRFHRRQVLRILPFAVASNIVAPRFMTAAQTPAQSGASSQGTDSGSKDQRAARTEMEKVTGIGGFFFRAHDPDALARWYQQHLGVGLTPSSYGQQPWEQEAGPTAFNPFPETTRYFGDMQKMWMINFRVRDLDKMAAQLRSASIEVKVDPQQYPNGRFAHLNDPEGNRIELWQPMERSTSR